MGDVRQALKPLKMSLMSRSGPSGRKKVRRERRAAGSAGPPPLTRSAGATCLGEAQPLLWLQLQVTPLSAEAQQANSASPQGLICISGEVVLRVINTASLSNVTNGQPAFARPQSSACPPPVPLVEPEPLGQLQ